MSQAAVSATRQVTPVYARAESKRFCPSFKYKTGPRAGDRAPSGTHTVIRRDRPSTALVISTVSDE